MRPAAWLVAFLIILIFAVSGDTRASEPWLGPAFSSDPNSLIGAASQIAPAESPARTFLDETTLVFDEAQHQARTRHMIYQILTEESVEWLSSVDVPWQPWHQERPSIRVRVITPTGAVHWLDPNTIADSPVPTLTPDIYSDARLLRAPLPAIAPGAIVEQEIIVRDKAPFFEGGVVERFHIGWIKVPVSFVRVSIEAPSALPIRWTARLLPDLRPVITEAGGRRRMVFERHELPAVEMPEPFTPSDVPSRPELVIASGRSWADVAARYSRIVQQQIEAGPVQSISAETLAGATGREEIVRRMLDYVTRQIRYTGVEFGIAGIQPGTPAETIKRRYGDCKDQASMLVSMLRDAGVEAQVALLKAGFDEDVEPELPGLGEFNHAIVFVPGAPALWIDPTDRYARAGILPAGDRGRWALVASPQTVNLVRLPDAEQEANRTVENREVILSEEGPAKLIETTEWFGSPESRYRAIYATANPKELREQLERYVKDQYLADRLVSMEHSQPQDLSSPFKLTLETHAARVGMSDSSEAIVAIRLRDLTRSLQEILDADLEGPAGSRLVRKGSSSREAARERRSPLQIPEPFVTEWRYKIVPPPGFRVRDVPYLESTKYGPALLTARFEKNDDMTVSAILRFEVGKQRLSPEQVVTLREDLNGLNETTPLIIEFESIGEAHLSAGRLREALDEFHRLAALHPTEARHRAQCARALLAGGMGDKARSEARAAISMEPEAAGAHRALGWILQHDLIGRRFGKGSDRAGALEAYRKAKLLDPKAQASRIDLANLLEHDAEGLHYGPTAAIDEALAEYRDLRKTLDLEQIDENILAVLFRSGRYDETRQLARSLDSSLGQRAYLFASIAASSGGPAAALAESSRMGGDTSQRRECLRAAATLLLQARHYSAAADLMTESLKGSLTMGQSTPFNELIRKGRRFDQASLSGNDPRNVVRRIILTALDPRPERMTTEDLLSESLRDTAAGVAGLQEIRRGGRLSQGVFEGLELPWTVGADLLLSMLELDVDGSDAIGYRVTAKPRISGMHALFSVYLVVEQGRCRLLSLSGAPGALGRRALKLVQAGDLEGARRWLNWAGDDTRGMAYDPLSAIPFSGLWGTNPNPGRNQILYAAASLVAETPEADEALPILKAARLLNISEADRLYIDLARARAYLSLKKHAELLELAQWLVKAQPKMGAAFTYLAAAHAGLKQWPQLRLVARERLGQKPDDWEALRALALAAAWLGDLKEEESTLQRLIKRQPPSPDDLNNLAWLALCRTPVKEESIRYAEQAVMMTGQTDAGTLHTLAALYSETGRLAEAHQAMIRAMQAEGAVEPDGAHWFVLGQIAAAMGEREAALAAYAKVTPPSDEFLAGHSTYQLARQRIRALTPSPAAAR